MNFIFIYPSFNDTIMNMQMQLVMSLRIIPKGAYFMSLYAVSFFGHRQIDHVFVIEQR